MAITVTFTDREAELTRDALGAMLAGRGSANKYRDDMLRAAHDKIADGLRTRAASTSIIIPPENVKATT